MAVQPRTPTGHTSARVRRETLFFESSFNFDEPAHCFSVGSFRGIPAATVTNESSVGLRSCRSRAQLWSARQYAGPSSTTRVCICMPVMTLCCRLRVFLRDGFFFASGEFVSEFLQEADFGVACALPAEFFFAPFCDVLESSFGRDDDREHPLGDHEELLLDGGRETLPVPERFEVEEFADAVELDEIREFGDRVRDDVRTIAALVPGLFADEFFSASEEQCFDDDASVVFLVELFLVLLPFGGCVVAEAGEVLLRSLADDVREEPPSVLVLRKVRFRDELLSWGSGVGTVCVVLAERSACAFPYCPRARS